MMELVIASRAEPSPASQPQFAFRIFCVGGFRRHLTLSAAAFFLHSPRALSLCHFVLNTIFVIFSFER